MTLLNQKSITLVVCIMVLTLLLGLINIYHHLGVDIDKDAMLVEQSQKNILNQEKLKRVLALMSELDGILGYISQDKSDKGMKASSTKLQKDDQIDSELIKGIKNEWLHLPSKLPLNLTEPNRIDHSQNGQSLLLDGILKNKTHRFYIECGAYDGERFSNSLFFERYRQWEGLLIEADPHLYKTILMKNRNVYSLNNCLSPTKHASMFNYTVLNKASYLSGLADQLNILPTIDEGDVSLIQIQCFPFDAVLMALGNPHVDFFSLDIEGAEVDILKTIPLKEVDIDMFLIEVGHPSKKQDQKIQTIENILKPYGYKNLHISIHQDILMSRI